MFNTNKLDEISSKLDILIGLLSGSAAQDSTLDKVQYVLCAEGEENKDWQQAVVDLAVRRAEAGMQSPASDSEGAVADLVEPVNPNGADEGRCGQSRGRLQSNLSHYLASLKPTQKEARLLSYYWARFYAMDPDKKPRWFVESSGAQDVPLEKELQKAVQEQLGGETEVNIGVGRVDLLFDDRVVEIKRQIFSVADAEKAVDQIKRYNQLLQRPRVTLIAYKISNVARDFIESNQIEAIEWEVK